MLVTNLRSLQTIARNYNLFIAGNYAARREEWMRQAREACLEDHLGRALGVYQARLMHRQYLAYLRRVR